MKKTEWKEDAPKKMSAQELADIAGDYAFELHVARGYTVADTLEAIRLRMEICLNGYEEAMAKMQFKREG